MRLNRVCSARPKYAYTHARTRSSLVPAYTHTCTRTHGVWGLIGEAVSGMT